MVSTTTVPKATVATAISVRDLSLGVQGGDLILKTSISTSRPGAFWPWWVSPVLVRPLPRWHA